MKKSILSIFIIFILPFDSNCQNLMDKLSKRICKCLEKNSELKFEDNLKSCTETALLENFPAIKEHYKVKNISDIDTTDMVMKISMNLFKNCKFAVNKSKVDSLAEIKNVKNYSKNKDLNCDHLKEGKFYYLSRNRNNEFDTTHVIIKDDLYVELMDNNTTYSKLKLKWVEDCKIQLTFLESNNPFKKALSKKGDKYEYEIIQEFPKLVVLKMNFHERDYFLEYFKE